jgi:PIN domain nuclease of toxin-antitoxin system
MDVFVLDACALIAFLRKEKGYEKIVTLYDTATNLKVKIIMHAASVA